MAPVGPTTQGLGGALNDDAVSSIDHHYRQILRHLDPDCGREGLADTPRRVARALLEMTSGNDTDAAQVLGTTFDVTCDEMVAVTNISFTSLCEHHILPFMGVAHVAYVPGSRVVGLSKIPRLVECFSRRLQVQERLTNQIADAMNRHLDSKGVGVMLLAQHHCMSCRGVRQSTARMVTSALRGVFLQDPRCRQEFMSLVAG